MRKMTQACMRNSTQACMRKNEIIELKCTHEDGQIWSTHENEQFWIHKTLFTGQINERKILFAR